MTSGPGRRVWQAEILVALSILVEASSRAFLSYLMSIIAPCKHTHTPNVIVQLTGWDKSVL